MTADRALEVAAVAITAFATSTATAMAVDATVVIQALAGIGAAGVSGWFASRITTERRLSGMEQKLDALTIEMRTYYARKRGDIE